MDINVTVISRKFIGKRATSQENDISLEMEFKLAAHFTRKCDFIGIGIHTYNHGYCICVFLGEMIRFSLGSYRELNAWSAGLCDPVCLYP